MAKKKNGATTDSTPDDAVAVVPEPALLTGVDSDGFPVVIEEASGRWISGTRTREIYIGGQPYAHVSDDADGTWIYAPRNVQHR